MPNPPRPPAQRRVGRAVLTLGALVLAATAAIVLSPGAETTIAAVGDPLGAGGEFHAVTPTRVQDSRGTTLDIASRKGKKPTGPNRGSVEFDVPLLGGGSPLPANGVLAVVANITVVQPTRDGYLTAYPKGSAPGVSSVANFRAGQNVANSTILRPGTDGKVSFHFNTPSGAGQAHLLIDITGWFSTSSYGTRGARVVPIDPTRAYDTGQNRLVGAQKVPLQIRGKYGVPASNDVVGVIVNLTGVNTFAQSRLTYLSVVPDDFSVGNANTWPKTSNLNLQVGQTRANLAIVPIGADGKIRLFSAGGEVRTIVDVTGYLVRKPDDSRAGRVIPLETAFRSFDTRQDAFYDQPLGPAMAEDFSFEAFVGDVKVGSDHVGPQSGLFGNLTAVGLQPQYSWGPAEKTHLTVYPSPTGGSQTPPTISNLNLTENEAVPNMALLRYGDQSRIRFFNFAGYVDYILDVYAVVLAD